ncbi:MAG: hypothetical protein EB031_04765 [Proteobacteria bacterium]|nr:hypothetical protein [Pseudomonadota bacterium]
MISDKAIIDKNFKIESSIEVGPFSVISKDVKIGKNTKIHSHVVITGDTNISEDCEIYATPLYFHTFPFDRIASTLSIN